MLPIIAFNASYYLFRTADQGLAHALALPTLRHGTSLIHWLGVHTLGALPSFGMERDEAGFPCANRFFMTRDPGYPGENYQPMKILGISAPGLEVRVDTKAWTFCKGMSFHNQRIPFRNKVIIKQLLDIFSIAMGAINALLIPGIKIRVAPERLDTFIDDANVKSDMAVYSEKWISPLNIGLVGTVWNSLTYKTPVRMFKDPRRVITGLAMLALSGGLGYAAVTQAPSYLIAHKTALIAGAILAVI
jgi:hypothetical protein